VARVRLRGSKVAPATLRAHDRHRPWVVLPVLAVLLVYCWCYTHLADWLGLTTPRELFAALGLDGTDILDADGNIDAKLRVSNTALFGDDDERLIVFAGLFGCFLTAYFAPLRWKSWAVVAWFVPLFAALYGLRAAGLLVAAHLAIWLAFHPTAAGSGRAAALWGGLVAALAAGGHGAFAAAATVAAGASIFAWLYRRVGPALARGGRLVALVRTCLIQTCMIVIIVAAAREGLGGRAWALPLGLLFFCYQWARLMVYHADYRDGEVPRDLPLGDYLALFLTPVALPNLAYAPYLGQGYTYLKERHLADDKTALVLSGLGLWCLALVYMVFAERATAGFIALVEGNLGVETYAFTSQLVRAHLRGEELSTPTVLLSTVVDQARIYLIYGGVTHFRVGAWRIMGWRVDTQYDRPWLATNLAALWGRFAFHFREFLVRVFYYPVFFAWFKRRPALRIFAATMVATVIGNLIWGHVPPRTIADLRWSTLTKILSTWPYFLLLGLGISLTQVWLLRRPRTRKPWTRDRRIVLDVLCAYLTFQFFALIHVFIRPQDGGSLGAYVRLFLRGFGIRLE
jgi:D-alanyl-lipoteichoic acid acyltransferase DltB (MBOAT superfamily)